MRKEMARGWKKYVNVCDSWKWRDALPAECDDFALNGTMLVSVGPVCNLSCKRMSKDCEYQK